MDPRLPQDRKLGTGVSPRRQDRNSLCVHTRQPVSHMPLARDGCSCRAQRGENSPRSCRRCNHRSERSERKLTPRTLRITGGAARGADAGAATGAGKIPKFSQLRGSGVAWLPFRGETGGRREPPGRSPAGAGAGAQPPDPSREQPGRERRKTRNSDNRSDLGADFADRRAVRTSRVASESLAQIRGRISPAVCKSSLAGKRP